MAPSQQYFTPEDAKHEQTILDLLQFGDDEGGENFDVSRYFLLTGDLFVVASTENSSALYEIWMCTKNFPSNRTGARCKVVGVKLEAQDQDGFMWLLKGNTPPSQVLRSKIFPSLLLPRDQWQVAGFGSRGDAILELNPEYQEQVQATVDRGIQQDNDLLEQHINAQNPEDTEDPAVLALEERRRRDRFVDAVTGNLERSMRTRNQVRSIYHDARLEEFGYTLAPAVRPVLPGRGEVKQS
jgi:hypothetical protein